MCQKPSEASSLVSTTSEGDGRSRLNPLAEPYTPPHFAPQKLQQYRQLFTSPRLVFSSWGHPSSVHYYLNPQRRVTFRTQPIRYREHHHVTPGKPRPVSTADLGKNLGKMEVPRTHSCKERMRGGVRRFVPPRSMRETQGHRDLIRASCGERKWVRKQHDSSDENKHGHDGAVLGKAWVVAENAKNDDVRDDPEAVLNGSTTVMIRNIPNQFKRKDLLYILDKHCEEANAMADSAEDQSKYDFVYLPVDFKTKANKGYAFVNFTNPTGASGMYRAYHNFRWECLPIKNLNFWSRKVCEISPAKIQGKVALACSFKNRAFPCREYQPLVATETPRNGRQKSGLLIVIGKCQGAASALEAGDEASTVSVSQGDR
ncbi:Phosphatidylinositol 4-phosphate 5-kinase [Psidium guajava]|nr:Phosphatidylinositol 4-phosphate 5-kinase [Psidium guajava]